MHQARDALEKLAKDWDPTARSAFNRAVESSMAAGATLLEEALSRWQQVLNNAKALQRRNREAKELHEAALLGTKRTQQELEQRLKEKERQLKKVCWGCGL